MKSLATGEWLTRDRVRRIALVAGLLWLALILWLFASARGTLDWMGRPLGTDFSQLWTAGKMALDGRAAEVWDWPAHFAVQREFHGKSDVDVFGWHYPPPFLLVAGLIASLPYIPGLIAWQAATLAPLTALVRKIAGDRDALLLTLAAPATLICIAHGHNGFLTALLLGGGLMLLDKRPLAAGLLLGCLIYKPQFGLILPVLLLAGRNWRAILGACLSAAILVAATLALWGWPVWQAFLDSLPLTSAVVIEQGATGWHKIMTPFAALRMWGTGVPAAYAVQSAATVAAMVAVGLLAWRRADSAPRNALVCAAVLIATPYALDYDLVVLLPALAWLWIDGRRNGFLPWDGTLMASAWFAPLLARGVAEATYIPLGLLSVLAVAFVAMRRAGVTASPFRR